MIGKYLRGWIIQFVGLILEGRYLCECIEKVKKSVECEVFIHWLCHTLGRITPPYGNSTPYLRVLAPHHLHASWHVIGPLPLTTLP